ncbi:formylglycine-generating enzyme family protein [candidate division KSB1 bacterium]|nr:formylglycine-generating enzyme family protein [candidate division KSB1 bacterium]RQW05003.1 MAG: formylglycine-generating enzyme family protein [candidate division KSB1 bacterium]
MKRDIRSKLHIYLGQFEVTQAQWEAVMEVNPSYFKGQPDHPVEKVTWRACQKFIKKMNALGQGTFRLPTEAEWEYACRAGTSTRFYFGDAPDCSGDVLCPNADEYMWWAGNNEPEGPKQVGLKKPNAWGLYDMHGNVHEWCADRWQAPYDRVAQIDPPGPQRGSRFLLFFTNRTARGGCFRHGGLNHCRSAYRFKEQASDFYYGLGFRLVREVEGNER